MKAENNQPEETEDQKFARTGVFSTSFKIDIKITEEDLLRDLVNKTEGKNIEAKDLEDHNRN